MRTGIWRIFTQFLLLLVCIYCIIFVVIDSHGEEAGITRAKRLQVVDEAPVKNYACVRRKGGKSKWSEGTHYPNQLYYEYIISKEPQSFIVREPKIDPDTKAIIVVLTKNTEEDVRRDIRNSWANQENPHLMNGSATVIFVTGDNDGDIGCLQNEANQHGDLLIVKTLDSYRGLVYKLLMAFQFISAKYPNANLIKIDRDCILDISRMMTFLDKQNSTHFIYGYLFYGAPPIRDEWHMWFVPESVFNETWYPWYVNGNFYVVSAKGLAELMSHRNEVQVVEIEDLFFTGILRQKANVSVGWLKEYRLPSPNLNKCPTDEQRALIAHGGVGDKIIERYAKLLAWRDGECMIPTNSTAEEEEEYEEEGEGEEEKEEEKKKEEKEDGKKEESKKEPNPKEEQKAAVEKKEEQSKKEAKKEEKKVEKSKEVLSNSSTVATTSEKASLEQTTVSNNATTTVEKSKEKH